MPLHQHRESLTVRVVVEAIAYDQCPPTQRLAWHWLWRRLLASPVPPAAASQEESPGMVGELSDEAQTQQSP